MNRPKLYVSMVDMSGAMVVAAIELGDCLRKCLVSSMQTFFIFLGSSRPP